MARRWQVGALGLVAILVAQDLVLAQGGRYRGPGDPVGPVAGGSEEASPVPTPGPAAPGEPVVSPGGLQGPDLSSWTFWWEHERDRWTSRRYHALRPTPKQVHAEVVPALVEALRDESNPDVVAACLVALAKIGDASITVPESRTAKLLKPFLKDPRQGVSEIAALALGIQGDDRSVPPLLDLAGDTELGRELVGRDHVPLRTRVFATFALGGIGSRTTSESVRLEIVEQLVRTIREDEWPRPDRNVAATIALGLVPLATIEPPARRPGDEPHRIRCRTEQLDFLLSVLRGEDSSCVVRAHVPQALGRLLVGMEGKILAAYREHVAEDLIGWLRNEVGHPWFVVQGAVLALGQIGDADSDELDCRIRAALVEVPRKIKSQLPRHFSLIALARVGGNPGNGQGAEQGIEEVARHLEERLRRSRGHGPAWAALAIGVLGRELSDAGVESPAAAAVQAALREELGDEKNDNRIGAYALAAGLLRDGDAVAPLLEHFARVKGYEALGYLSVGIGLLGDRSALEPIQKRVVESKYHSQFLLQASIAYGLLGDKEQVPRLLDMLARTKNKASLASIAWAIGHIGDRRAIEPLVEMLRDPEAPSAVRSFAAATLGLQSDDEDVPWHSRLAIGLHYLASTRTLVAPDGTGLLQIL